ncbi:isochorismate synthase [Desertifilum sp. FACHB-1129]|uniref:isochorismate synthase n=1 Tax=Desertifilum tharense IPPAS B-1220 TaxID=1781255 RepID=A0A1E5QQ09_9CYAN|nr:MULTISPECIES: isochorismate synthase [Desertifilum]MDA0212155.1 isochorismate synthase [Cyanobacteria bacterium FC1]MBD2313210.1 isochorismate synthase [Desertifilum sp. FACHB-1129]MBD2323527.1 isochorismate synthase [Desertifilum sp. FACHB-866]MBD2334112.1 isochorismate synthase [Desertifilum sp. FACHB-868]OEJ76701.1 isochorismate synthase [Desertifilum tharense IPPAS B-1220]
MVVNSRPVIPYPPRLFQDRQILEQFLLNCQQNALAKKQPHLVSISQEIPGVDPLLVLQEVAQPNQLNFYWENRNRGEAIAAINSTKTLQIQQGNRFQTAQKFIQDCFNKITASGDLHLRFSGPHFFCNFTFFERPTSPHAAFPAATLFLPQLQIATSHQKCVLALNLEIHPQTPIHPLCDRLWQQLRQIKRLEHRPPYLPLPRPQSLQTQPPQYHQFKSAVSAALEAIDSQKLSKIVLAHAIDIRSPIPFRLIDSLSNLRRLHPDCHVFLVSNGKGQHFMGASPERLMSISDRQLATDALAGSAPRGKTPIEDADLANRLIASEKERREHRFVIDFITQRLTELGLTPQLLSAPQLLQLSNIQHLWTPIAAKVPPNIHPLDIVAALHPTPAVAGDPCEVACQEIQRYEAFERGPYAAPLGWVDRNGNSEFIVGIRSALIAGDRARLYAGAGIVSGSNPDKELAEIQLKLQALLKALV